MLMSALKYIFYHKHFVVNDLLHPSYRSEQRLREYVISEMLSLTCVDKKGFILYFVCVIPAENSKLRVSGKTVTESITLTGLVSSWNKVLPSLSVDIDKTFKSLCKI